MNSEKILSFKLLPPNSIILDNSFKPDYFDCFGIEFQNSKNFSIDILLEKYFSIHPKWVEILLKIRNILVKPFGLKTEFEEPTKKTNKSYQIGDVAVIFHVQNRNEHEIVLAENDKHLYFRTSVLITQNSQVKAIFYIITCVKFNNKIGRIYFFIIKPFHKLIIKSSLKKFIKLSNK